MAIRVDLQNAYLTRALEAAIASLRRSLTKTHNPAMEKIIQQDILLYQTAINTLQEIK